MAHGNSAANGVGSRCARPMRSPFWTEKQWCSACRIRGARLGGCRDRRRRLGPPVSHSPHAATADAPQSADEARFRAVVEASPYAIFVQTGGRFRYLNPAALGLFSMRGSARAVRHGAGWRGAPFHGARQWRGLRHGLRGQAVRAVPAAAPPVRLTRDGHRPRHRVAHQRTPRWPHRGRGGAGARRRLPFDAGEMTWNPEFCCGSRTTPATPKGPPARRARAGSPIRWSSCRTAMKRSATCSASTSIALALPRRCRHWRCSTSTCRASTASRCCAACAATRAPGACRR